MHWHLQHVVVVCWSRWQNNDVTSVKCIIKFLCYFAESKWNVQTCKSKGALPDVWLSMRLCQLTDMQRVSHRTSSGHLMKLFEWKVAISMDLKFWQRAEIHYFQKQKFNPGTKCSERKNKRWENEHECSIFYWKHYMLQMNLSSKVHLLAFTGEMKAEVSTYWVCFMD